MAEGRGVNKTVKRAVADATTKPKKKSPLATTQETSTELAPIPKGKLEEVWSKTMIREAQRLDEKIVKTIDRVSKDFVVLGEMFQEMQDTGYHRALGFGQFGDYLKARYPGRSTSQINQAMRIVRELTSGDNPTVSKEDVREMSRDNAEGLAKLKKQGLTITPELIEQAKSLPVYRFEAEVLGKSALNLGQRKEAVAPGEVFEAEVQVKRVFYIAGTTNSNLDKAIEIIKFLGEGIERDRGQSLDDYIVSALVGDFLASYAKDYEEMVTVRNNTAIHAATMTEDALGPESPSESPEDEEDEDEEKGDEDEDEEDDDEEGEGHVKAAPGYTFALCHHIKGDGNRCQSPSLKNSEYCHFHKKLYVEGARQNAQASIQ